MSRNITLRLTQREAEALCHAAGNSLQGDEMENLALFNDERISLSAALRAIRKLEHEIYGGGSA